MFLTILSLKIIRLKHKLDKNIQKNIWHCWIATQQVLIVHGCQVKLCYECYHFFLLNDVVKIHFLCIQSLNILPLYQAVQISFPQKSFHSKRRRVSKPWCSNMLPVVRRILTTGRNSLSRKQLRIARGSVLVYNACCLDGRPNSNNGMPLFLNWYGCCVFNDELDIFEQLLYK